MASTKRNSTKGTKGTNSSTKGTKGKVDLAVVAVTATASEAEALRLAAREAVAAIAGTEAPAPYKQVAKATKQGLAVACLVAAGALRYVGGAVVAAEGFEGSTSTKALDSDSASASMLRKAAALAARLGVGNYASASANPGAIAKVERELALYVCHASIETHGAGKGFGHWGKQPCIAALVELAMAEMATM